MEARLIDPSVSVPCSLNVMLKASLFLNFGHFPPPIRIDLCKYVVEDLILRRLVADKIACMEEKHHRKVRMILLVNNRKFSLLRIRIKWSNLSVMLTKLKT